MIGQWRAESGRGSGDISEKLSGKLAVQSTSGVYKGLGKGPVRGVKSGTLELMTNLYKPVMCL